MRPIGRSRNVVRMLAATLVPEHCSSGHCGKLCRWSHLISSAEILTRRLMARPAACRRGTAVRSACCAQGRRDGPVLSTDARHAPEVVMRMLLAELDSLTTRELAPYVWVHPDEEC